MAGQLTVVSWQSPMRARERLREGMEYGDLVMMLTRLWADQGACDVDGTRWSRLIREKIRKIVKDPQRRKATYPHDHPRGAKRPCLENQLLRHLQPSQRPPWSNLRQEPISRYGLRHQDRQRRKFGLRCAVYANGFDAMDRGIKADASDHRPRPENR